MPGSGKIGLKLEYFYQDVQENGKGVKEDDILDAVVVFEAVEDLWGEIAGVQAGDTVMYVNKKEIRGMPKKSFIQELKRRPFTLGIGRERET